MLIIDATDGQVVVPDKTVFFVAFPGLDVISETKKLPLTWPFATRHSVQTLLNLAGIRYGEVIDIKEGNIHIALQENDIGIDHPDTPRALRLAEAMGVSEKAMEDIKVRIAHAVQEHKQHGGSMRPEASDAWLDLVCVSDVYDPILCSSLDLLDLNWLGVLSSVTYEAMESHWYPGFVEKIKLEKCDLWHIADNAFIEAMLKLCVTREAEGVFTAMCEFFKGRCGNRHKAVMAKALFVMAKFVFSDDDLLRRVCPDCDSWPLRPYKFGEEGWMDCTINHIFELSGETKRAFLDHVLRTKSSLAIKVMIRRGYVYQTLQYVEQDWLITHAPCDDEEAWAVRMWMSCVRPPPSILQKAVFALALRFNVHGLKAVMDKFPNADIHWDEVLLRMVRDNRTTTVLRSTPQFGLDYVYETTGQPEHLRHHLVSSSCHLAETVEYVVERGALERIRENSNAVEKYGQKYGAAGLDPMDGVLCYLAEAVLDKTRLTGEEAMRQKAHVARLFLRQIVFSSWDAVRLAARIEDREAIELLLDAMIEAPS